MPTQQKKKGNCAGDVTLALSLNWCITPKKKARNNVQAVNLMIDDSCTFCRIVRKKAPASIVFEDEQVLAFLDIKPLNTGHTLVIPKEHHETIFDVSEELVAYLHGVTKRVALAVKKATRADGISIFQQNGKAAGQQIFHFHVHVVPRYQGQKLAHFGETSETDREKLEQTATEIKQCM